MATKSLQAQVADLSKSFIGMAADVRNKAADSIAENMLLAESNAKALTPVDTGRLRANNRGIFDKRKLAGVLFNNVVYAPFINFGTGSGVDVLKGWEQTAMQFKGEGKPFYDIRGNNFFSKAADTAAKNIVDELTTIVKNAKL